MSDDVLIVIPARMASTRFPGKPLADIAGISMIRRTANIAQQTAMPFVIATDHPDIETHCKSHTLPVIMTPSELPTGSDRALSAADKFAPDAEIIVNLQGDAPFTPVAHLQSVIEALQEDKVADIATPYVQLSWAALDGLRDDKKATPFSGTTLIANKDGMAVWFSKNIIPAIRKEATYRETHALSPVLRHIGLYAYRRRALEQFVRLPASDYETLEGLEQLRALENGMRIKTVSVDPPEVATPGIDTPEDLARAEALIAQYGDPFIGA